MRAISVVVLDRAQQRDLLSHVAQRAGVEAAHLAIGRVAQLRALVPEAGAGAERPHRLPHAVREEGLGRDLAQLEVAYFLADLLPEPGVRAQERRAVADDQRRVVTPEPREIAHVDGIGDQDTVDAEPFESATQTFQPPIHAGVLPATRPAKASRASR